MEKRRRPRSRKPAWGKLAALAGVVLALFAAWRYTPLAEIVTAERVLGLARTVGGVSWSPLVVLALYTPAAFVMFPRPLITLFAVVAYGPWLGFATAMTGILLSAVALFYAGRALPDRTLRNWAGERFERATAAMRGRGFIAAFAVSVAPVAPFPVIGMVAGAGGLRLHEYLGGTALGMLPGTLATTVFADQLRNALEDPSSINLWVVAGVVVIFAALALGARHWMLRMQAAAKS